MSDDLLRRILHEIRTEMRLQRILALKSEDQVAAQLNMTVDEIRHLEQQDVPIGYRLFQDYLRALRLDPAAEKWAMISAWLRDECPGSAAVGRALAGDRRDHAEARRERSLRLVENSTRPSGEILDLRSEVLEIARRQSQDLTDQRRAHMLWVVRASDRSAGDGVSQVDGP